MIEKYTRLCLGDGTVAVGSNICDWDDFVSAPTITFEQLKAPHPIGRSVGKIEDDDILQDREAVAISFINRESALVVLGAVERVVKMFDEPIAPHWVRVEESREWKP